MPFEFPLEKNTDCFSQHAGHSSWRHAQLRDISKSTVHSTVHVTV